MTDPKGSGAPAGPQEGRCGAVKERDADGRPVRWCRKYPRRGQVRCEDHGGNSPQALAAAERRQVEQEVARELATLGEPTSVHYADAAVLKLHRSHGEVLWLKSAVGRLSAEELTWGTTEIKDVGASQFGGIDRTEAMRIHALLDLYDQAEKREAAAITLCHRIGIDLRQEERLRAVSADFQEILGEVLSALGHDPESREVLLVVVEALQRRGGGPAALPAGAA